MNKLAWSITCIVIALLLAGGTWHLYHGAVERLVRGGRVSDFKSSHSVTILMTWSAAAIYFWGMGTMMDYVHGLPRSRTFPLIILLLITALLSFLAYRVGASPVAAGLFMLWSYVALGTDRPRM